MLMILILMPFVILYTSFMKRRNTLSTLVSEGVREKRADWRVNIIVETTEEDGI